MADKDFGVKRINLVGAAGTPTITSPTDLIINANKVAISTNSTVGGSLGIGTTNPTEKLWVNGNGYFTGIVTANKFSGQLDATSALTQSVGFATTATNLAGGTQGSLPYQNSPGITSFLSGGQDNQVLLYNLFTNKPEWGSISSAEGFFGGIEVQDEDSVSIGNITRLNFRGDNIIAISDNNVGISTITIASNLVGTGLSISGITTVGSGFTGIVINGTTGIITSLKPGITTVTFVGNLTGTASTASFATTAFKLEGFTPSTTTVGFATTATNIGSGDTGSLPYQKAPGITTFLSAPGAGSTNQVLLYSDSTSQPVWSKVGLGTNTIGNYVKEIYGTTNEIELTLSTTGAGVTHRIGFVTSPTIQGSLEVKQNLNVLGNITIGGTVNNLIVEDLLVKNKDIVLGVTTDINNNDVSTDFTANGGGIAIASTEGSPLVNINVVGFETHPSTYKKIMWFESGTFAGLATDAWLSNYAFGIGTTSMPVGTRFAAGNVTISRDDITSVRNINSTGITTIGAGNTGVVINGTTGIITSIKPGVSTVTFVGNLTGTASTAGFAATAFKLEGFTPSTTTVGFATTATNIGSGDTGSLPYQKAPGITTFLSAPGTSNQVLIYDLGTNKPTWGSVTENGGAINGITVRDEGVTSFNTITTLDIFGSNITATSGGTGIASIRVSDNLVGTGLSISGITTIGAGNTGVVIDGTTGIITSIKPGVSTVTFVGNLTGTASTAGFAFTAFTLNGKTESQFNVAFASTAGIATNLKDGVAGNVPYQSSSNTTAFITNGSTGQVLLSNGNAAPSWGNVSAASGSFGGITVRDEGTLVGTADSIRTLNFAGSNIVATATTGANGIATITISDNLVGSGLSISGITTIGAGNTGIVINGITGIITSISGFTTVVYYGDGSKLTGIATASSATSVVLTDDNSSTTTNIVFSQTPTQNPTASLKSNSTLIFNAATSSLGIGTTVPTSKLTVQGNVLISGITTSGITRISSSTASPNVSIPVATLEAVGSSTNYDIAIVPKGNGAIVANIPDGTSVGGNKRGTYAVDLQLSRNGATQVASGENSFIGNGYRNTASGWYSAVLNGSANASSSTYSIICGGASNAASGEKSFIGNGAGNSVAGNYTSVINGEQNNAQTSAYCIIGGGIGNSTYGDYSSILCASYSRALRKYSSVISGHWGDTRNTYGAVVFSGANESFGSGFSAGGGYQQSRLAVLSKQTTNATPSTLTADGNAYDALNAFQVVTKSAYLVKGSVIAYSDASDLARAWEFTAAVKNTSGVSLVGTPIINDIAYDSGASGWNLSITADSGTSSLKVEVTGQASTTIRWVTKMDSTEVAFQ